MPEDLNPYAAPAETVAPDPRTGTLDTLRGPTTGLLVLTIPWLVMLIIGGIFSLVIGSLRLLLRHAAVLDEISGQTIAMDYVGGALSIGDGLLNVWIAHATWSMRFGKRYRHALAAAILTCVPFIVPCIWLGIPFGIWALIVLHRKDVRAAFES
jgi:uncharacterized membrane protein